MPALHALANPARFLRIARPLTPLLFWLGVALAAFGAWAGLTLTPRDYLQGEAVRILYIHVPTAWLGMGGWSGLAIASLVYLIWRHPLANLAARAIAPAGALFAALCLITGSIWGRPTWGTWWEWDGRLTSMLLLFFVYHRLYRPFARRCRARRGRARARVVRRRGQRAAADHPLFGGVVEHAPPGRKHRSDEIDASIPRSSGLCGSR